jgi:hypothetical protein
MLLQTIDTTFLMSEAVKSLSCVCVCREEERHLYSKSPLHSVLTM